jgi:MFS family permease
MIAMRGLQGYFGGVLIPMAFTLVFTKLPKPQQPIGLAMFSLAVTFAPAIGPTIGGYLTENYGWQTIFFVNVVPTAVMVVMLYFTLERQPMQLGLWKATGSASPPWRSASPRCRPCWKKATRTTGSARPSSSSLRSSPRSA